MSKETVIQYIRIHHRKGTVPIPPADESAGFLGTFFIEGVFHGNQQVQCTYGSIQDGNNTAWQSSVSTYPELNRCMIYR